MYLFVSLIISLCGLSGARNQREGIAGTTENYKDDTSEYFDTTKDMSALEIRLATQDFEWSIRRHKEKPERKDLTLNTMESFWSMYHNGNLQEVPETKSKMLGSFWRTLQIKVGPGSIVEIGGCQTSFDASADTNKTVLALLTDSQTVLSSENNIPTVDNNLFLGRTDVENIQTWIEKLKTYPVLFGNVILNKVSSLSENLLPHEFIQLLVKIFSVSRQIFLVDSSVDSSMLSYFEANWPRPKELVEAVCKAGNLMCYVIKQTQGWNEERYISQVTINSHQRQLDPHFCLQYQPDGECYLEYSLNNTKIINQQNKNIVENINENYIPLDIIPYLTEISEKSLEDLLLKLLRQDDFSDNDIRNIMLDGEHVIYNSIWNGDRQQDHEKDVVNEVKRTHVLKKTGRIEIPNKIIKTEINVPSFKPDAGPQVRTVVEKMQKSHDETIKDITDTVLTLEEKQVQLGLLYLTQAFQNPTKKTPRSLTRLQFIKPVASKSQNYLNIWNRIFNKFPGSSKIVHENRGSPVTEKIPQAIPRNNFESKSRDSRNGVLNVLEKKARLREKDMNTTQAPRPVFRKRNLLSVSEQTKKSINKFLKSRNKISGSDFIHKSQKNTIKNRNSKISEDVFDILWSIVKLEIPNILGHNTQSNVLVYGEEVYYCLFSCKLSMMYPLANIITIVPQKDSFKKCLNMVDTLSHRSNLVFNTKLDSSLVNQVYNLPQLFDLQILGMDILRNMITTRHGFLLYLGKLITQAKTTILELPPFHHLQHALDVIGRFQTIDHANHTGILCSVQGMIQKALQIVQADYYTVRILHSRSFNNRIVLIQLNSFNKKIKRNCKSTDSSIMKYNFNSGVMIDQDLLEPGITLQYIITLKLHPAVRSSLFKEYLKLPIIKDMCPINILWSNQTLIHRHLQLQVDDINIIQQRIDELKSEIKDEQFLFLDINNNDKIVTSLSQDYKNSTFVSMRSDKMMGEKLYNETQHMGINNIAVTTQVLDYVFTDKLLHSPDIFRYSYLGYTEFLGNLMEQDRHEFDSLLGNLLSTSITSFIEIPSSQIISLATSTFFPDYFTSSIDQSMYLSDNHPLTEFINIETDIIYQSAKADVEINIAPEILPSINNNKNIVLPWKLVRIDIQQLKVKVGHHFDFEADGHKRSYNQHVKSENKTQYNVYLVRETDQFLIPYGNVNAITLIALLRMGLIDQQKESFYKKFVQLPLYEDMATWNIVFRHGNLEYIDFDTKNSFYDKMVPSAAKIIAVLTNYRRTVLDFNKCDDKAKNSLGFHYISACVGSEFEGPCPDLAYPVPCGDHTCRSTYIACLKALLAYTKYPEVKEKSLPQDKPLQWSFNKFGAIKRKNKII